MKTPKPTDVRKGIAALWETLQCPICLDLMTTPVSTKCDHQFCKFCLTKLLDSSKQNSANCPVCKSKITRRSLQESPGFQRLVSGLQDIIQAYEHDTGTNYFTGMPHQKKPPSPIEVETDEHLSQSLLRETLDQNQEGLAREEHPGNSLTSTLAAQTGFASLMGLEDSAPLMTENEGLDSGLGDVPPTSDKKMSSPANSSDTERANPVKKTAKLQKTGRKTRSTAPEEESSDPDLVQGNSVSKLSRKPQKKKKIKDTEPGDIFAQSKKKSVEKVAEWLLKVPVEEELVSDKSHGEAVESDSGSSTSTIDLKQHNFQLNLKREGRAKALEEEVFGAVYKKRVTRASSPPHRASVDPPSNGEVPTDQNNFRPRREVFLDDVGEQDVREVEANDDSSDFFKRAVETEVVDDEADADEDRDLAESEEDKSEHEISVVDINKTTRRTRSTAQEVDSELAGQCETVPDGSESKKPDGRKGRTSRSRRQPAKGLKPLVLVGATDAEISGVKVDNELGRLQDQIENYPSSEDPELPVGRGPRRSRRLQIYPKEIQQGHEKARCKANAPAKDRKVIDVSSDAPKGENVAKAVRQNGCVYDQDIDTIEKMEIGDVTSHQELVDAQVPQGGSLPEAVSLQSVSVVPNSTSPSDVSVVQRNEISDTGAVGLKHVEEEKNDSELDTEQLMRSFKSAKRKSFHLGQPNGKRMRQSDDHETPCVSCSGDSPLSQPLTDIPETTRDTEKSSCGDIISPSISPNKTTVAERRDPTLIGSMPNSLGSDLGGLVGKDVFRGSFSSGLSPNKVSKRDRESSPLSVVPHVGDSGLIFRAVHHQEPNEASKDDLANEAPHQYDTRGSVKAPYGKNGNSDGSPAGCKSNSISASKDVVIEESSLTPDGLLDSPVEVKTNAEASGEVSVDSVSQTRMKRVKKRRRAQRLESSPESSSSSSSSDSGEELPTLKEILGAGTRSPAGNHEQGSPSQADQRERETERTVDAEEPCNSPDCVNSSQVSVDLFGTPEERELDLKGEVPIHNASISIESSQFSSEVLATQQKLEMQKELLRLEKLMALVTEVLQEKEGSPKQEIPPERRGVSQATRSEADGHLLHEPAQGSDRKSLVNRERDDKSDEKVEAQADATRTEDFPEEATPTKLTSEVTGTPKTLIPSPARKTHKHAAPDAQEDKENNTPPKDRSRLKLVMVSSGLGPAEQITVKKFARRVGARVVSHVTSEVTHVVMRTDDQLVCERTLKYFLGIASRKWVVSFQWISECFRQKKLLDEGPFEVRGDVVNGPDHQGPQRARTAEDSDLLLRDYRICFQGPFTDMTTAEMEWMAEQCGATVIKDPLLFENKQPHQLVIVQPRCDSTSSNYNHLSRKATVLTRGWLLDTIATYTLQNLSNYTV